MHGAPRPQLAVSAAIFRGPDVLLVRRAREPGRGLYSFPGGRVEFGETLEQALRREIAEEVALEIDLIGLAGWREVLPAPMQAGHFVVLSFAARWIAGEVALNDELDDHRWLAPEAVGGLRLTSGLEPVLKAARALALR